MTWILIGLAISISLFLATVFFGAPYVPTHKAQLDKLVRQLDLSTDDVLIDCGAGDGLVGRVFAKHIKQAVGYEINPILILVAKIANRRYPKNQVKFGDFRRADWPPRTTIVYYFGVERYAHQLVAKLRQHQTEHHRPLMVISYGFDLPGLELSREIGGFKIYQL